MQKDDENNRAQQGWHKEQSGSDQDGWQEQPRSGRFSAPLSSAVTMATTARTKESSWEITTPPAAVQEAGEIRLSDGIIS